MERSETPESTKIASSPHRKIELPWLILAALLLSTLLAAFQSSRQLRADADARFAEIALGEQRGLLRQLRDVESLLMGAKAFSLALADTRPLNWDSYAQAIVPAAATHPGVVAIQFVQGIVAPDDTSVAVISPAPLSAGGIPAWSTSPALAEAIGRAASTRMLVLSKPLGAPGGSLASANHFALVLPLDTPAASIAAPRPDNRAAGTVVAIIDLAAMLSSMESEHPYPLVRELFDGQRALHSPSEATSAKLPTAEMTTDLPIEFGQRLLRLKIASTPQLEKSLRSEMPRAILVIGIFGTMLLGALVLFLTRLREQAEALASSMTRKLQDQTRFTEDLIEFNPNPIFRKDTRGRFVAVNQAWEQLSGRKRQDVLGNTDADPLSAGVPVQDAAHDAQLLATESGYEAKEALIVNTDGRQYETIVARKILKRADGTVDGIIGTITDVTLIKKLERELARQREQLDLVIRSSQQGIWDLEISEGGASYYSARFREILGYPSGKFPERFDWQENIHPEDYPQVRGRIVAHFKGFTRLFDIECRIKRSDGKYMWVSVRAIAQRDSEGRAVRFVGSITDVTDRKEAEVALTEANVRVTEAARAKEAFLATMSHEIRTPMNGVLGITSLLNETNLNEEQRDYIRLIRASGDTLLRLIDDVLDFSKIESGHMTLESIAVELVRVAEDAFELVAEKAREKDLALLFEVDDSVPAYVLGDATRLRQVLLNLLSNAIKFTEKGEIKLQLGARRIEDGRLMLEGRVTDTGIGIPPERAQKLFQPFTQADASTTRKYGGTGLGLAIVRRLSQLMGGDVRLESAEGQGSIFIFSLSTSEAEGPMKPYMQRNASEFSGKRMLVVDRNANRAMIQQRVYTRWGFDTVTASRAAAAQVFALGPRFDILLVDLDVEAPETLALRDALEADDRERERRGEAPVVVILLSAVSRAELSQRQLAPALRHSAFVMLPASRVKMFDVLTRALTGGSGIDIANRPYTPTPVYDKGYRETSWMAHVTGGATPLPPARPENTRRDVPTLSGTGCGLRILVAEDNEINQRVIQGMLKNLGCDSDLAGDGSAAVEMALAGKYDVILMDIHMPALDGITAMQRIRVASGDEACPPIVAVTAHALPGDREHYLAVGMNDYISKPIRPGDLKKLLERLFPAATPNAAAPPEPAASPLPPAQRAESSAPTSTLAILDTDQIEDLRYLPAASGAAADVQGGLGGLVRLYQAKTQERLALMETQLATGQWASLAETAHSLRGSAASVGFPRVAARCKDLELAARRTQGEAAASTDSVTALAEMLAAVRFHSDEADVALLQWLASSAITRKD